MMAAGLGPGQATLESGSAAMRAVVRVLTKVALHDVPVLLRGEGGSGKSVLARALHRASPRRDHPLVTLDGQALRKTDLASARLLAEGLHQAQGGTLLLEEVTALPERWQVTLASVLERPGERTAWARVVATTHRDLEVAVKAGEFREDLLGRLNIVEVRVPPLRDRPEDIVPLAREFLQAFSFDRPTPTLTPRAQRALVAYPWPGNIRELRNAMQRAVVLSHSADLDADALPPKLLGPGP